MNQKSAVRRRASSISLAWELRFQLGASFPAVFFENTWTEPSPQDNWKPAQMPWKPDPKRPRSSSVQPRPFEMR